MPPKHISGLTDPQSSIAKLMRANAHRHRLHEVFRDFCEMAALSLSNAVDAKHRDKREARYLDIVQRYERAEIERFPQMLAHLVEAMEAGMHDCLGGLFMALELGDHWKGQFFTPYHLSKMMAQMTLQDAASLIERHGFITLQEPACGAGGMVVAAMDALQEMGINYQQAAHVTAIDLDATAVHMTYIQLTLLHVPAVVVHGNALWPEKTYDVWVTPAHVLGGWDWKLLRRERQDHAADLSSELATTSENMPAQVVPAMPAAQIRHEIVRERVASSEQLALF